MSTSAQQTPDQLNRLPDGGLIDRLQSLTFHFDGKRYSGYAGDTLASALLAAGVKLVGRSFKYHRPRGIMTVGSDEPNALESIATLPRGLTKVSLTVPVRVPLLAAPEEFSHQLFALLGVAILPRDCASGRSRSVRGSHGAEPVST